MKHIKNIIVGGVLSVTPLISMADNFYEISSAIVASNPQLKALQSGFESDIETMKAENALDNPEIEAERLWHSGPGENRWSIGVSQGFRWPGAYISGNKAVSVQKRANILKLTAAKLNLMERTSAALIAYVEASRRVDLLAEADTMLRRLSAATESAYKQGETTILEVNRTAVEAASADADYQDALAALAACRAELESLGYNSRIMPALSPDIQFPDYRMLSDSVYIAAIDNAPEMQTALAEIEMADARLNVARSGRFPGFRLGYQHAYEDGSHFNGLTIGMELPLWRTGREIAAANSTRLAAGFQAEATRTETTARVRSLMQSCHSLQRRIAAMMAPVENSNNQRLLRMAFEGGQISLLDYLRESAYFLQARLDLLALRAEYARQTVSLQYATGLIPAPAH